MTHAEVKLDQVDEEVFAFEVSDEALEATAESAQVGIYTLGYCTGLSACPA
jgi:hypothetical protein